MLICGVDDAGRGAVIGPLVVAGILIEKHQIHKLVDIGVKDSKLVSPGKRVRLAADIIKIVLNYYTVELSPSEIDEVVEKGSRLHRLNRLEARAMAAVISYLRPKEAYVDASDVLPERFGKHISEELSPKVRIISEHKADIKYPVVSAASILAKVRRDRAIADLRKTQGDLGSGYIVDPKTKLFLEQAIRRYGSYPNFVRKSWKPAKRIRNSHCFEQKKIL